MLGSRKKPNEKLCAERIYEALADGEIGDMTAEKLRLPKETRARYGENTLHYREAVTLCALLEVADKQPTTLHPVLQEYENLLETKRTGRGLNVGSREFRYAPIEDLLGTKDKSLQVGAKVVDGISQQSRRQFHGRFVRGSLAAVTRGL
jgi:hypothetical protein